MANITLVTFVADRLNPKSSAAVISAGELVVVNDKALAAASAKLAV